jgi:hypothetical protein
MINPFRNGYLLPISSHLEPLFIPRTMPSSDVETPGSSDSDSEPDAPGQVCVAPTSLRPANGAPKVLLQRQAVCVESPRGQLARLYKAFRHLAARGRI